MECNLHERIEAAINLIEAWRLNDCDDEFIRYATINCCPHPIQQEIILNLLEQGW
tara:strand:+ start:417 stop:581 length:165 start_codon:yes stop_codon:yes gene_type:complete